MFKEEVPTQSEVPIRRNYGFTKQLQYIEPDDLEKIEREELVKELNNLSTLLEEYIYYGSVCGPC